MKLGAWIAANSKRRPVVPENAKIDRTQNSFGGRLFLHKTLLSALLLSLACLFPAICSAVRHSEPRVLIINSYHPGYVWSEDELTGLLAKLRTVYPMIDPRIEHLDAKRFAEEEQIARTKAYLVDKYRGRKFDLVVALDNPAFELVLRHRDEAFPGLPVVFAGVNDFDPAMLEGKEDISGVAEIMDIEGTLKIALTLHPHAKKVLVIHDLTASGMAVRKEMEKCLSEFENKVAVEFLPPVGIDEIPARLNSISPDSLGLILTFTTDAMGRSFPLAQSTRLIASAGIPVYATHETRLGHGIVGGLLLGGKEHGRKAGEIALRVLAGEDPDDIPVVLNSTSMPMFDYKQLVRHRIPAGALPEGSVIINRPESLLDRYRTLIFGTLAVIFTLLLAVIALTATIYRRRAAEEALRASEAGYRMLHNSLMDAFASCDMDGRITECNQMFRQMLGYRPEEILRLSYRDITPEKWHAYEEEIIERQVLARGYSDIYEKEYRNKQGKAFPVELRTFLIKDSRDVPVGMGAIVRDITERARQNREITHLNRLYSVLGRVSQAVVRAKSPETFLDQACRELVEGGGFRIAWVGCLDPATGIVVPKAAWGGGEYVRSITVYADDRPEGRGPTGRCIRERRLVVYNDYLNGAGDLPWRDMAASLGIASAAAFPIERAGRIWGTLTIYSAEVNRFGEEDVKLLEKVAGDIEFALDNLDREALRKKAEAALAESEQRFKMLYQGAPLAYQSLDEGGNFIEVNQAWLDSLGWSREEVIGRNFAEFLHPDWIGHFRENFPKFKATGAVLGVEFEMRKKDGSTILVVYHGRVGRDARGQFSQTHCIFQDITEQRRAEERLRESEQRFRSLFENTPVAYQSLDFEGRYIDMNQELCKLLGYSPDELYGRNFRDVWHESMRDTFPQLFEKFKQDRQISCELLLTAADGRRVSVILEGRIQQDSEGNLLRTHCILTDITRRKQAEDEANTQRETLARVFESAPYIMMLVDRNARVTNINRRGIAFAGRPREELLGLLGGEAFNCFNAEGGCGKGAACAECPVRTRVMRTFENGESIYDSEGRIRIRKDGEESTVDMLISTALVNDKETDTVLVTIADITDRKRAEEEKTRLEAKLRQSQKLEAVGTLAGGVAHDFNNILSPIIGYTEMALLDTPPLHPMRYGLEQVLSASLRAKDLVKQILAFGRTSQERDRMPIEISPTVKEALKLLRASLPTTIDIKQTVEPGIALADPTQIHQIVVNLCTNAAHAMNGEGVLRVSLTRVELSSEDLYSLSIHDLMPGSYLRLCVSDTGSGMSAEIIDRIFEPYFTTKETGKGSGLGLAVVHGIVKRHQGAITVQSEPGKGATFTVFIPQIEMIPAVSTEEVRPMPLGTERILLVDDESIVAEMGTAILEKLGYGVTAETESPRALKVFSERPGEFDLVITDYTMPKLTGTELAREIRRIRPGIPIILCTGYSEKFSERTALELGVRFLMKPYAVRQIADVVREVLDTDKK